MSTASWTGVQLIIRNRLLTFTPEGGGPTLRTLIGSTASGSGSDGKLYLNQAPDDLTGFWGVFRVIDAPVQGADGGFMIRATAELILYGLTRKTQAQVEAMADTIMQAWNNWSYVEEGGTIIASKITSRFPIPYVSDPADREVVAIRMLLPFRCTPIFLTRYAA
jgi:hypothetical protein